MKICLNCHSFVDDDAVVCPECGQDFSEYNHCPNCGREYLGFSYICSYCGHPLYNNITSSDNQTTKTEHTVSGNALSSLNEEQTQNKILDDNPAEVLDDADNDVVVVLDENADEVVEHIDSPIEREQVTEELPQPTEEHEEDPEESTDGNSAVEYTEDHELLIEEKELPTEDIEEPTEGQPIEQVQLAEDPEQPIEEPELSAEESVRLVYPELPIEKAKQNNGNSEQSVENAVQPAVESEPLVENQDESVALPDNQADVSAEQEEQAGIQTNQLDKQIDETVEIVQDDDQIIVLDNADEESQQPTVPVSNAPSQKKKYSRRHVADKIGKKEDSKSKSKVLSLVNETDDSDADEEEEKKEQRFSKWLHWFLFLFFLAIIAAGVGAFLYYDNLVSRKKEAQERVAQDSLFNLEKAKQQKIKQERAIEDSLLNLQISALHESDSLDEVRKNEFRRLDSIRVDTFMTRVITDVCPSNQILARQLDGKNYIYYYTDLANPIFMLYGFDGVKKETFTVIDNIQARLVGSYVTPDRRCLIILCKDEKHDFGLAYKYNMYESTLADYESMDKDENKCYDVGTTDDGFYMKFGKGDSKSFQSLYTSYFDKYGNFITQK